MAETNPAQSQGKQDISFQVMPRGGKSAYIQHAVSLESPTTPPAPPTPPSPGKPLPPIQTPIEQAPKSSWGFLGYLLIGVIVFSILGGLAYYFLGAGGKHTQNQSSPNRLPSAWLQQYFNKASCDDDAVCGENADPDKDGLTNYKEFVIQTNPTNPDTDADGIADGDEVNIYNTLPLQKYTDTRDVAKQNDYNDGVEIKNGYDPQTPGLKLSQTRQDQIQANIQTYGLHEPTITTLNIRPQSSGNQTQSNSAYLTSTQTVNADIANNQLPNITVHAGDAVVWLNQDVRPHHLVSSKPLFESQDLLMDQTFSFTFTKAGVYTYYDKINPNLKAAIHVE